MLHNDTIDEAGNVIDSDITHTMILELRARALRCTPVDWSIVDLVDIAIGPGVTVPGDTRQASCMARVCKIIRDGDPR